MDDVMPDKVVSAAHRRPIKAALGIVMASVMTMLAAWPATAFNFAVTDAGPVPEIVFLDGDGNERTLADFQGRVVVLNLWATWCAPCRKEMPSLDRLQAAQGGDDLEVVAISIDRGDITKVTDFFDELGVTNLAVYHDPTAKVGRALRAPGLPTTLVIDRQGNEIGRVLGDAEWDGADAVALLKALMAQ